MAKEIYMQKEHMKKNMGQKIVGESRWNIWVLFDTIFLTFV